MIVITSNEKLKQKTFIPSSTSPVETLGSTRRILSTPNCSDNCFFLWSNSQCQTLSLDKHVKKVAQELVDIKLLAKLSEGDMIATGAKYHRNCLIRLCNAYRDHYIWSSWSKKSGQNSALEVIQVTFYYLIYNPLMHNVSRMSHIPQYF